MTVDERFSFPIKAYFEDKVKQKYPEINTNLGSAFHDLVMAPSGIMLQSVLDRINVLKRDQSIINYSIMTDNDMALLASNYFVTRNEGARSYGLVRIYLNTRSAVTLSTNTYLSYEDNRYSPITMSDIPYESIYLDTTTSEWYFEAVFIADEYGASQKLFSGDTPIPYGNINFSRAEVLVDFSTGKEADSNTDMYSKIIDSVTNNELVKPTAIKKILMETFPSIFNLEVITYGDEAMDRDLVEIVLPLDTVVRASYCKKVNVPLNSEGVVQWRDSSGNIIANPVGGWVGAIYDLTGKDFRDLDVTWDGRNFRNIAVQPGFSTRFLDQATNSPDQGPFKVRDVTVAQPEPNTPVKNLIIFERRLQDIGDDSYAYSIKGSVAVNSFHIGGKVDVYVDSVSNEEAQVLIAMAEGSEGVIEIPLVDYIPKSVAVPSQDMFEDQKSFISPVLRVVEVAQVDPADASKVIKILSPEADYTVVRAAYRAELTADPTDVLRITTKDEFGLNPFIGARLRVTYLTNRDFSLIQSFVDDPENKTTDILIKPPSYVLLDVNVTFDGDLTQELADELITSYIVESSFDVTISSSEINDILFMSGATYVQHPIYLEAIRLNPNGDYEKLVSADKLTLNKHETFYPVKGLNIVHK